MSFAFELPDKAASSGKKNFLSCTALTAHNHKSSHLFHKFILIRTHFGATPVARLTGIFVRGCKRKRWNYPVQKTRSLYQYETPMEEDLPVGTNLLGDQFTITEHLSAGGFGITYRALDNQLGRTVVIKECFPSDFCIRHGTNVIARTETYAKQYRSIVEMFMREARSLAQLRHPNIVSVHSVFEENKTAYMVLDLIDGRDLLDIIEARKTNLTPSRVKDILVQLLDAIEQVHEIDLLHRDISPDNIIIEKSGTPVLIDFGAARGDASRRTRAMSSLLVVKDGYSPQEFYVPGSSQTPSSDLFALGATFYHLLSGKAPVNAQTRMMEIASNKPDPCAPLVGRIEGYDPEFLRAIDTAMQVHPSERLQSAAQWHAIIAAADVDSILPSNAQKRTPKQDINLDFELNRLVEETNHEVRKSQRLSVAAKPKPAPEPPKSAPRAPEWLEEFNRESMAQPVNKVQAQDNSTVVALPHVNGRQKGAEEKSRVAFKEPDSNVAETNWVDRALEKQERVRAEQEREQEAAVAQNKSRRKDNVSVGQELKAVLAGQADDAVARNGMLRTMLVLLGFGFLVGLLMMFSTVWFFPGSI
ncbi:MAG: serine/threonine-protein kinase [Pseudomonadota bacterium]